MSDVKITDLVPQETIDKIKELDTEMQTLTVSYANTARELAKGLNVRVTGIDDVERLITLLTEKDREAAATVEKVNTVIRQKNDIIAQTTPVISRQLMEQERLNKAHRDTYDEQEKVKRLLESFNGTYEDHLAQLVKINNQLKANSKEQKDNEKALSKGTMTMAEYNRAQVRLVEQHRYLTQEKRTLQQIMTAEEKAMQTADTSYVQMSQQLELLKKAYKDLSEEGRNSEIGREMETSIQNLDAHLKDMAADMGEFQRNVGNYAIAGQNGVVSTESLIAVLGQEARTTQDLIDQTKILEESKAMLDRGDANYAATLETLNAKIEENKAKLRDVSDIIDKDATSVAEAESQNKRLYEALKHVDLTSDGAQARIKELNDKIEQNTRLIRENTPAIADNTKEREQQKKASEGLAGQMLNLIGLNSSFGSSLTGLKTSGNVFEGLKTKVGAFGSTLTGLLANPWVIAFLGLGGVVAGFKWWYEYNKGLAEASKMTQHLTGLTGEAADKITVDMQTLADHMGKGYDETIGAANTLVQQFGISWNEAMSLMEDGLVANADLGGNFVANIERFAPALRDAGVSADEFVAILSNTTSGIFNEKGVNDIIKGGTRLRAMTKGIADALDTVGISSAKMQKDLADGNITMLEAVQQVAGKLKELPENSQEAGELMKQVFGRTAAEGGTLLIQSIADVNTNLDECKERTGELGKLTEEQMEAEKKLHETIAAVFKMGSTSFQEMTTKAKTLMTKGLTKVIEGCISIYNWFVDLYNGSLAIRVGVSSITNAFKTLWEVAKLILNNIINTFSNLGKIVEGVFTLNWSKIKEGVTGGVKGMKDNFIQFGKNMADNVADSFNTAINGKLEYKTTTMAGDPDAGAKTPTTDDSNKKDYKSKAKSDKEAKEAEKRAKEELKRIMELEESKINVMKDGHEKDLALIRLKYQKKISEISKNGETEKALRVQLAEECENEIAKCEEAYQKNLAKTNLANRLAAVKKGSREELDLKLAQLEASRRLELEEAEKTGADVNLINAKFEAEKLKLKEDYAQKAADEITKESTRSTNRLNNDYLAQTVALKKRYDDELKAAGGNKAKIEKIERDFSRDMEDLNHNLAMDTINSEMEMLQKILDISELSAEKRYEIEAELAAKKMQLQDMVADHAIQTTKRAQDDESGQLGKRKEAAQQWLGVASEAIDAVSELAGALFDREIAHIEALQEANQEAGQKEQDRIQELKDKKVISDEDAEARKRAAEARTAQKEKELAQKKAELQHRQAVWDKANSIAQAAIATALGITQALPNVVLAAIVGAMGALQLATILATPIPKYAKGTDYHKGGLAIVGDGGRQEAVLYKGGVWLTPSTPTLVDMPRGAMVLPDAFDLDSLKVSETIRTDKGAPVVATYNDSAMRRGVSEVAGLLRQQIREQKKAAYNRDYEIFKSRI